MAKITKDQVNKINAKCKNGFTLSLYTAIIHGEKCLEKDIQLDDSGVLYRVTLRFKEKYEKFAQLEFIRFLTLKSTFLVKQKICTRF